MVVFAAAFWSSGTLHAEAPEALPTKPAKVVVIPIRAEISSPELYILRRGLKVAMEQNADAVVLDMETPGGSAAVTMEMMEALDRFKGRKITYVNDDAGSAGAIIAAVTDEIHMAPTGVIGAAELIFGTGQDVGEGLKRKMNSYLSAKIRSYADKYPMRAQVIEAMMDSEFEFKVGETVIKPKGKLLTLTAQEAVKTYGDPPQPLLASGIAGNLENLLDALYGKGGHAVTRLEPTWSEGLAQYIVRFTPLLMGIGLLGLFIEFKTPGFGVFGIAGIALLAIVFFGQNAAGLSGHEPALIFMLGVVLLVVEVFFFPGTVIPALAGIALMLGSLVWAMVDHWPGEAMEFSGAVLIGPMLNLAAGVALAVLCFIAILKFLPKGGPWGSMILETSVGGNPTAIRPLNATSSAETPSVSSLVGQSGVAATSLFPSGQVNIAGRRYEARLEVGFADPGTPVRVTGQSEFGLIVEVLS